MRITQQVSSYYSRKVKEVNTNDTGWEIVLEGNPDVRIINEGDNAPEVEAGSALLGADLDLSQLFFGVVDADGVVLSRTEVEFNQETYLIYDPEIADEPFTPTVGIFDPETPPEPVERIAEAPEGWSADSG